MLPAGFEPLCNYKNYDAFDDTDKELVKRFLDQLFNGGSVRSNRICTFGAYDKIKIEKESGQKRGSRKKRDRKKLQKKLSRVQRMKIKMQKICKWEQTNSSVQKEVMVNSYNGTCFVSGRRCSL